MVTGNSAKKREEKKWGFFLLFLRFLYRLKRIYLEQQQQQQKYYTDNFCFYFVKSQVRCRRVLTKNINKYDGVEKERKKNFFFIKFLNFYFFSHRQHHTNIIV